MQRPQQTEFVADFKSPFLDFIGGNRCGKTYGGAEKCFFNSLINSEAGKKTKVLCIEPTLEMSEELLRPKIETVFANYGVGLRWIADAKKHKYIIPAFHNSEILLRSANIPERIEGGEYSFIWIDEPAQCKQGIWKRVITRLNDKKASYKQIITTGTPEGLNWYYKEVTRVDEITGLPVHRIIHGSVDEILLNAGQDHIDRLKQNLDPLVLREKLTGEFLNTTSGRVYYAFDESVIIPFYQIDFNLPLRVSCDFNINPCIWNLHQIVGDRIFTFGEIVMYNANTQYMCDKLSDYLRDKRFPSIIFYGDYTSIAQRTTATSLTDWSIIESNFKNHPGYRKKLKSNPKVKARIESQNGLFAHDRHKIARTCKYLVDDYRQVVWDKNGYDIDKKSDSDRTHASDGTGYMINYEFGIDKKYGKVI